MVFAILFLVFYAIILSCIAYLKNSLVLRDFVLSLFILLASPFVVVCGINAVIVYGLFMLCDFIESQEFCEKEIWTLK